MNENLRNALLRAHLDVPDVAAALEVAPKTVSRWLGGRDPYPRYRRALAELLQVDEAELWPEITQRRSTAASGIVAIYPHRWAVPRTAWLRLFQSAECEIAILAYSALFLAEDTGILHTLAEKATAGARVRILLGDPDSQAVADRGTEEGIGPDTMAAKIRNALVLYAPLSELDGVQIRLHQTALYNSLYRADAEILVNAHIYATPAANAPTWHVRATDNADMLTTYLASYEHVWDTAKPYTDDR